MNLELKKIEIPFRTSFKHASAERSETESVWVEARSDSGRIGCGESCPRAYVTGEDLGSVRAFFSRHRASLEKDVADVSDLHEWMRARQNEIDANPAAWCAIELALLDLLAKEADRSVEALLGVASITGPFRYSAVIGDSDLEGFQRLFDRYLDFGFRDYKLKLSGKVESDRAKIDCIRSSRPTDLRVRLDANNLWDTPERAARYLWDLDYSFFAIEEPLRPNQYPALSRLAASAGVPVILDESFLRVQQLELLDDPPDQWILNLRVSKMGGLIRSLEVLEAARSRGIPVVIGAQVGETSLLTRAALTVAQQAADLLVAQEGAFGLLLLEVDVCDPPLMFGRGGVLDVQNESFRSEAGLGIGVSRDLPFLRSFQ